MSFVPFKTETQEGGYIRTSLQIQVGQETFGCFLEDVSFDYDYCYVVGHNVFTDSNSGYIVVIKLNNK